MDTPTIAAEAQDLPDEGSMLVVPTHDQLIRHIEGFLERSGMKPTPFGIEILRDGNLLNSMKKGRQLSLTNARAVCDFIADWDARAATASSATKSGENISSEPEAPPAHPFSATSSGTSGPAGDMPSRPRSSTGPTPVADRAEWPVEAERPAA